MNIKNRSLINLEICAPNREYPWKTEAKISCPTVLLNTKSVWSHEGNDIPTCLQTGHRFCTYFLGVSLLNGLVKICFITVVANIFQAFEEVLRLLRCALWNYSFKEPSKPNMKARLHSYAQTYSTDMTLDCVLNSPVQAYFSTTQ